MQRKQKIPPALQERKVYRNKLYVNSQKIKSISKEKKIMWKLFKECHSGIPIDCTKFGKLMIQIR
jgi:hypothetical protein